MQDFKTPFAFSMSYKNFPVGDKYRLLFKHIKDFPPFWKSLRKCYKKAVSQDTGQWKERNVRQ
jgi:hypothetical protein